MNEARQLVSSHEEKIEVSLLMQGILESLVQLLSDLYFPKLRFLEKTRTRKTNIGFLAFMVL